MHQISKRRFDILAAYARGPLALTLAVELAWFEAPGGEAVATLFVDTDNEFASVVMAPDLLERYRAIHVTGFHDSWQEAVDELRDYMHTTFDGADGVHAQGDESGSSIDFFAPKVDDSKWHPTFRLLREGESFAAARTVVSALMRWHDVDGNFIEQFQTTGFDARIWELYLFAALTEAGLFIERPTPAPDFVAVGRRGQFALEATIINPSVEAGRRAPSALPATTQGDQEYHREYLPIRYAGPLTAKLAKRYWEHPEVVGLPLVFAIQDFHDTMSMFFSGSALPMYLYGWRQEAQRASDGRLTVVPVRITEHVWRSKVVTSGFFDQPNAENVSAVIFNSLGTLSKFNRMGVQSGFGSAKVMLIHSGAQVDLDPDASEPIPFSEVVTPDSSESWIDGMDVFHNPNASRPLDPLQIPGAAHHRLLPSGLVETTTHKGKIISSTTAVVAIRATEGDNG